MTREAEINQAAEADAYQMCKGCSANLYCKGNNKKCVEFKEQVKVFAKGVKWADEHQKNVWHDAAEEPEIGSNIVAVDEDGQWWDIQPYDGNYDGYGDLTGWSCCVVHYNNIKQWAYIKDLLPKGGEE